MIAMQDKDIIIRYLRLLDETQNMQRSEVDILLSVLSKSTSKKVISEILELLEPHLRGEYSRIEKRLLAHADDLPDDNKYKKAVKAVE